MQRLSHFFWLIPFLSFLIGYSALSFLYKNAIVKTPALVGQNLHKALITLSNYNLNIRIINQKDEPELPEGTIVSQTPAAGKSMRENQAVYVVVTKKPSNPIMPNVCNKPIAEATKLVENSALQPKVYAIPCDYRHAYCIAQFPQPGSATASTMVTLYSAQAQIKPVIMPNLKNKLVSEVMAFLSLHGITPTIAHAQSDRIPAGHDCAHCIITDQRPHPGSLVIFSNEKPLMVQLQVN